MILSRLLAIACVTTCLAGFHAAQQLRRCTHILDFELDIKWLLCLSSAAVALLGRTWSIGCTITLRTVCCSRIADRPSRLVDGFVVYVTSRNPNAPSAYRSDGASYHTAELSDPPSLQRVVDDTKPAVIFHCATPDPAAHNVPLATLDAVNIVGAKALIDVAVAAESVQALVFTSSVTVHEGQEHFFSDEETPLKTSRSSGEAYSKSKAQADRLMLEANGRGGLRTTFLRLTSVYGERDKSTVLAMMDTMWKSQHKIEIGDNKNLWDFVSVSNAVAAHSLAARKLLNGTGGIAGQAFIITDGQPTPFWDFAKKIWRAGGDTTPAEEIRRLPAGLVLGILWVFEFFWRTLTLGGSPPPNLRYESVAYSTRTMTFSVEKARRVLGFDPADDRDAVISKAVKWASVYRGRA